MARLVAFFTRRSGKQGFDLADWLTYGYLMFGVVIMFGPVLWLLTSSFKTEAELNTFPPQLLPYAQETAQVEGYDEPLPLFRITAGEHSGRVVAQRSRIGLDSRVVDLEQPTKRFSIGVNEREPIKQLAFAVENYTELFQKFNFPRYLWNSVFITLVSTLIMLVVNSMAAFALSKYEFRGRNLVLALTVGVLMIPQTVMLVPLFSVVKELHLLDSLWGVIIPGAATPTGVFLLRQYMLTIPDEIIEAARMDKASEWKIYWRIILPLSAPAIAVLAILAVMWRWNEFLWPLVVLSDSENFTLQLALNSFQGELDTQWGNLLAMTMLTLAPIALVFAFLQKYIATGIAATGGR